MWKVDCQIVRHTDDINAVATTKDMKYILTASSDKTVGVFNRVDQDIDLIVAHPEPILDIKISSDQNYFATASEDCTAKIWKFKSQEELYHIKGHRLPVVSLAWLPNSKSIITASHDGTAIVWDVELQERLQIFNAFPGWAKDVKAYQDLVIVVGNDRYIPIFDIRTGKIAMQIPTNTPTDLTSVSIHHMGMCLAASSNDCKVRIWDLRTSDIVRKQRAHAQTVNRVEFHPFTDDFMTVSEDGLARIWSLKTPNIIASFGQHKAGINNFTWCQDGDHFITVGKDKKIVAYYKQQDPELDFDGGDMQSMLDKLCQQMETISNTMKTLDARILLQEEKIRFLQDINNPISKASKKADK